MREVWEMPCHCMFPDASRRPPPLTAATRLQSFKPITVERPRVLLPLVNTPLIDYTLEWLAGSGVEEVGAGGWGGGARGAGGNTAAPCWWCCCCRCCWCCCCRCCCGGVLLVVLLPLLLLRGVAGSDGCAIVDTARSAAGCAATAVCSPVVWRLLVQALSVVTLRCCGLDAGCRGHCAHVCTRRCMWCAVPTLTRWRHTSRRGAG